MSTSNRERQKKWLEKKAVEGKKRITIIIDQSSHDIILQEKRRTGETNSSIVNRAIQQLVRVEETMEKSMETPSASVNDNEKYFEMNEETIETSRMNDGADSSPISKIKKELGTVSDNAFSSSKHSERINEKGVDDETHEIAEESDKGIGQARSLIKRLLSLTKNS